MPVLTKKQAAETLAKAVESAKPGVLVEIYAEIFPEKPAAATPLADALAQHIRTQLEAEEIVDLWNVVFPKDHNVWYEEQEQAIHYNEDLVGHLD